MKTIRRIAVAMAMVVVCQWGWAQAWVPKLGVAADSLTFATDSGRIDFYYRQENRLTAVDTFKYGVPLHTLSLIYRPPVGEGGFVRESYALPALEQRRDSIYRSGTAAEARKNIAAVGGLGDVVADYMAQNPQGVDFTWGEIPEPYKNIIDGKKVASNKDLRNFARELGKRQEFENELRYQRPKEKGPWTFSGQQNAQLSQLFLSNWTKGGETSSSLLFDFRAKAIYSHTKHQWETNGVHKLGLTRTSNLGTRISDDAFELTSKYGYNAVNKWYYSFQTSFKSQLFRSYGKDDKDKVKPLSALMSPAYIKFIFGMDYKTKDLSVLLSPFTENLTVVLDTASVSRARYGIADGKRTRKESGLSVNVNWNKKITTDVVYTTQAELFYPYQKTDVHKQFDWENIVDVQINRFLTTRFLFKLRYFDNESTKFQIKENYSISFKMAFEK